MCMLVFGVGKLIFIATTRAAHGRISCLMAKIELVRYARGTQPREGKSGREREIERERGRGREGDCGCGGCEWIVRGTVIVICLNPDFDTQLAIVIVICLLWL